MRAAEDWRQMISRWKGSVVVMMLVMVSQLPEQQARCRPPSLFPSPDRCNSGARGSASILSIIQHPVSSNTKQ